MRQLRPSELVAILKELDRQKTLQEYHEMRNKWAFLAAVFTNGINAVVGMFAKRKPKNVEPESFLGGEIKKRIEELKGNKKAQQEEDRWAALIQEAKAKGLKGPW